MTDLYGNKGIDTTYERSFFAYHPEIQYPADHPFHRIPEATLIKIERAKDFSLSQSLMDYDVLLSEIETLMQEIRQRNQTVDFTQFENSLQENKTQDILMFEDSQSGIRGAQDVEIFTVLFRMKLSVQVRRSFLDRHFRNQITDERDLASLEQKEKQSIEEWIQLELQYDEGLKAQQDLYTSGHDDGEMQEAAQTQIVGLQQETKATLQQKESKDVFHTTIADTAYVHRNRYVMFMNVVRQIKMLVYMQKTLLKSQVQDFMMMAATLTDVDAAKSHMILAFRKFKNQLDSFKQQYHMIDDHKEEFISKQQWMYQQLESKTNQSLFNWLYKNDEGISNTFDLFAGILATSIQSSKEMYEKSVVDMLKFYQTEAQFYDEQLQLIRKKEEIRQFFRILEDLADATEITHEWTAEYLKANGYSM